MQKWIQPPTCLDHGLHVLKLRSVPLNRAPKMRERHQLFFGLRLVSKEFQHPAIQTKIEKNSDRFFHQLKVRQPIGDRILCNRDPNKQEVGSLFKYSRVKFKKMKTYGSACPFQGLSNGPLSCKSNLAGTVPLSLFSVWLYDVILTGTALGRDAHRSHLLHLWRGRNAGLSSYSWISELSFSIKQSSTTCYWFLSDVLRP